MQTRRALTRLAGVTAAATVLVVGCGGDSDSDDTAGEGESDFCGQWAALEEEQTSFATDADGIAHIPEYFATIAGLMDELDPPDELANAVDTMRTTYGEVITAAEGFDWETMQSRMEEIEQASAQDDDVSEEAQQAFSDMTEAFAPMESEEFIEADDSVNQYVIDNCEPAPE